MLLADAQIRRRFFQTDACVFVPFPHFTIGGCVLLARQPAGYFFHGLLEHGPILRDRWFEFASVLPAKLAASVVIRRSQLQGRRQEIPDPAVDVLHPAVRMAAHARDVHVNAPIVRLRGRVAGDVVRRRRLHLTLSVEQSRRPETVWQVPILLGRVELLLDVLAEHAQRIFLVLGNDEIEGSPVAAAQRRVPRDRAGLQGYTADRDCLAKFRAEGLGRLDVGPDGALKRLLVLDAQEVVIVRAAVHRGRRLIEEPVRTHHGDLAPRPRDDVGELLLLLWRLGQPWCQGLRADLARGPKCVRPVIPAVGPESAGPVVPLLGLHDRREVGINQLFPSRRIPPVIAKIDAKQRPLRTRENLRRRQIRLARESVAVAREDLDRFRALLGGHVVERQVAGVGLRARWKLNQVRVRLRDRARRRKGSFRLGDDDRAKE